MTKRNPSVELSLPRSRTVRGYVIRRMPIGQFLKAAQLLQEAPEDLLDRLFPGQGDALGRLRALTPSGWQALALRAAAVVPDYAVRLFAQLSGLDERRLRDDPAVGLDGLAEMALAWMEVNGVENFINAAGALRVKVRSLIAGSKA